MAVASAAAVATCNARTASGKKASAAALGREREYVGGHAVRRTDDRDTMAAALALRR